MKKVIAVFDIGKTNKKILLFDEDLKLVSQKEQKFPVITDDDGEECDDIDLITNWMKEELEGVSASSEYDLVSVNFSTYGASLMFLDESGDRLTPVYNYLKPVSESIAENLFAKYGGKDEFCRKTASPALGLLLNSGIQILWMKEEHPEVMEKTNSIIHFPQYLSYVLAKEVVSEPTSIGCHTFMWDYDNMTYHQWLADNDITLPEPVNNDVVYDATIGDKTVKIGVGIHDSSSSLVPYLKGSKDEFILVSTGTWCISMNPFNSEPLTASQLEQDCLCFMSPTRQQVKSSRLFMGHFHEVWAEKLAKHYNVDFGTFKTVKNDQALVDAMVAKYGDQSVFFPGGKESFEEGLESADLTAFATYEEAYTKFVIDLAALNITAIDLVIPANDTTKCIYITGGFSRNEIYVNLLAKHYADKTIYLSEIDNASALGAAVAISDTIGKKDIVIDLGLKEWK